MTNPMVSHDQPNGDYLVQSCNTVFGDLVFAKARLKVS